MNRLAAVATAVHRHRWREEVSLRSRVLGLLTVPLFVGFLAFSGALEDSETAPRTVAVPIGGSPATFADADGLDFEEVEDVAVAVEDGDADLGIVPRPGAGGFVVFVDEARDESADALGRLRLAVAADDRPPLRPTSVISVEPVRARRNLPAAELLIFGLAFSFPLVVGGAATAFGGATANRALEPLVLLPLRRRRLAIGLLAGLAPATAAHLLVLFALGVAVLTLPIGGLGTPVADLPGAVAGAGLAWLTAVPFVVGAALVAVIASARARESVVGLTIALPMLAAGFLASQQLPSTPVALRVLPGLSAFVLAADGLLGSIDVADVAVAAAAGTLGLVFAAEIGAWLLGRESVAQR